MVDDLLRAALEVFHRRRVRDADESGRVEGLAGRQGDARAVEERLRELRRGADAVGREEVRDVRKQVERARRLDEAEPRLLRRARCRAGRGGADTRRACRSRTPAGRSMPATTAFCVIEHTFDVEWLCSALQAATTARRRERPAAAPAGHRVRLGRRAAEDGAIAHRPREDARAGCAASDRRSASRSRGRAESRCRAWRLRSRGVSRSSSEINAPVGLPGEVMMMPRVFGVIA